VQVTAFCTPARPDWRWRIVSYAGEVVEESYETFRSIAAAVAKGTERMLELNVVDQQDLSRAWRSNPNRR
jgi:hypothetical protein